MDGLLIFKCCADFLNISSFFCCEFTGLSQPADSFENRTILGRGQKVFAKKKARNRGLFCEIGVSFAKSGSLWHVLGFSMGRFACKQIVTVNEWVRSYQH